MREGGKILINVLEMLGKKITVGATGRDLSTAAKSELAALGAESVLLGYQGYPDVICISVNDAVVHGIPDNKPFRQGDVVKLDYCVGWKGMITDAARTFVVGGISDPAVKRLVESAKSGFDAGVSVLKSGVKVGDIGAAIEKAISPQKLGIVRDLVGHGVGHAVHEEPNIPNYGKIGTGIVLETGMTIAIEPMVTLGSHKVYMDRDGWTIRTQDGSLAAQYENTVLIIDNGFEILTAS